MFRKQLIHRNVSFYKHTLVIKLKVLFKFVFTIVLRLLPIVVHIIKDII